MAKKRPREVKLKAPTVKVENWKKKARLWRAMNREAGGYPRRYPLTTKAGYVIGAVHDICASVGHLLQHPDAAQTTYLPAYQLLCSAVSLLGRRIRGNDDLWGGMADLLYGFKWIADSDQIGLHDDTTVVETSDLTYSVDTLVALGNYAAYGKLPGRKKRKGMRQFGAIDTELLEQMPALMADALQRYWDRLQKSERLCNRLAQARVIAIRDWPVLTTWLCRGQDASDGMLPFGDLFADMDWSL
jgi:hypothetical protein